MENATETGMAVFSNSMEIFKTTPEILTTNKNRSAKAVEVGNKIIADWQAAWKIEDENERMEALAVIDERSNNYLVKCGAALKEEKELRSSITQLMDEFKKMFTAAENEIDKGKDGTVPSAVQKHRNEFAKQSAAVTARKQKEAEEKAAKAQEGLDIKASITTWIDNKLIDLLTNKKSKMNNSFNGISLLDFDTKSSQLNLMTLSVTKPELLTQLTEVPGYALRRYNTPAEQQAILDEVFANYNFDSFITKWKKEVFELQQDLISKLPSKKNELLEEKRLAEEAEAARVAAVAAAAEAKTRVQKEAAEKAAADAAAAKAAADAAAAAKALREKQEAEELERKAAEEKLAAEQQVEINKQGEQTMAMFDKEAELAEVVQAPEARQGYEIIITHQAAWVQIFQLWFESEGKNLSIDKIGNTKMDQMKAWAEKHAHKNDVKIESKFMKYEPSYKAVNRKAATA